MKNDQQAGLYIHVPFCTSVCPYCDFAVLIAGAERRAEYLDMLVAEIELCRGEGWEFDTVYIGVGTPSSLDEEQLRRIISATRDGFQISGTAAIALEANPEDVDERRVALWRELGLRTVSLGVQSMDDAALGFLGRSHDASQARRSLEILRAADFNSVSVDLVYGLPGQDELGWMHQLEVVLAFEPDHLSCYQLTVHDGTVFGRRRARGQLVELEEDSQARLFLLTHRVLADAGYEGYEVSNFTRSPEHRSCHNRKYWEHAPYLGLGPAAHSFRGDRRWWNVRKLRLWAAAVAEGRRPIAGEERLRACDMALEAVLLGLRTVVGVDLEQVRRRFFIDLEAANVELVERLCQLGLLRRQDTRLAPTLEGMAVADTIARAMVVPGL